MNFQTYSSYHLKALTLIVALLIAAGSGDLIADEGFIVGAEILAEVA